MILDLDVCIGGDLFRFKSGQWTQSQNVRAMERLAALISPVRPVDVLTPASLGIEAPVDDQRFWLDNRERIQSPELERAISDRLAGRFYFGFETPPSVWTLACRLCPGAVDVRLHPIRFGDQIPLLARSNGVLNPGPESIHAAKATLSFARSRFLGARTDGANDQSAPFTDRKALIALQVADDSALLRHSAPVGLEAFTSDIARLAQTFDLVYVRSHPARDAPFETWRVLLELPNVWVSSENTYALLVNGGVCEVVAISSSVLHEADALGITATALDGTLSHGFPISPEYHPITVVDLVQEIVGYDIQRHLDVRVPGTLELFGRPAADPHALQLREGAASWPDGPVPAGDPAVAPAYGHGWNPAEAWGRWTSARVAALNFLWPATNPETVSLELELAVFPRPGRSGAGVEIWSQGRRLARILAGDFRMRWTTVRFEVPRPEGDRVQILIVRRDPVSPADHENAPDQRTLGVALAQLRGAQGPAVQDARPGEAHVEGHAGL